MPRLSLKVKLDREAIARRYAAFRCGKWFFLALAGIVAFWTIWNSCPFLPHFDDSEFGRLNLFLSVEASLSVALLLIANERQEAAQREQLAHLLSLVEGLRK